MNGIMLRLWPLVRCLHAYHIASAESQRNREAIPYNSPCVVRSQHQIENTILTGRMKTMPSSNEVDEMIADRISVVSVRASESGKPLWNSTLVGSIFLSQHSDQIILLICRHLVV